MESELMEIVRPLNRSWIDYTYFSLYDLLIRGKSPGSKCPAANVRIL